MGLTPWTAARSMRFLRNSSAYCGRPIAIGCTSEKRRHQKKKRSKRSDHSPMRPVPQPRRCWFSWPVSPTVPAPLYGPARYCAPSMGRWSPRPSCRGPIGRPVPPGGGWPAPGASWPASSGQFSTAMPSWQNFSHPRQRAVSMSASHSGSVDMRKRTADVKGPRSAPGTGFWVWGIGSAERRGTSDEGDFRRRLRLARARRYRGWVSGPRSGRRRCARGRSAFSWSRRSRWGGRRP